MRTSTIVCALGSLLTAAFFVGCGEEEKVATKIPGVKTGTLEQSWTIEGAKDPARCQKYRADRMRLVILDAKGEVHATELAPCNAFQKTVELQTDTYSGNVTFVDTAGYPVSRTLPIQQFTILEDRKLPLAVDFTTADMTIPR